MILVRRGRRSGRLRFSFYATMGEPGTKNQEPGTRNQELRTRNRELGTDGESVAEHERRTGMDVIDSELTPRADEAPKMYWQVLLRLRWLLGGAIGLAFAVDGCSRHCGSNPKHCSPVPLAM